MNTEKFYIKALQNISFKAFALVAYIILFVWQRLSIIKLTELEFDDIFDKFSTFDIAIGKVPKFLDYFGVELPTILNMVQYLCLGLLVLGLIILILSFFGNIIIQKINYIFSFVGFISSLVFVVYFNITASDINSAAFADVIRLDFMHFVFYVQPLLFLIGMVFVYAYVKMPKYRLAEGRFFATILAALNPKHFLKTFRSYDNTEDLFRLRVPLRKKKYATLVEPKAIKRKKKKRPKNKRNKKTKIENMEPVQKKLTPLEIALAKREHAEAIANARAEQENKSILDKRRNSDKVKNLADDFEDYDNSDYFDDEFEDDTNKPKKVKDSPALRLAKQRAMHAEQIANRKHDL